MTGRSQACAVWHLGGVETGKLGVGAILLAEARWNLGDRLDLVIIDPAGRLTESVAAALERVEGVAAVRRATTFDITADYAAVWPSAQEEDTLRCRLDSTERLQQGFAQTGRRPRLAMAPDLCSAAEDWLLRLAGARPVVAVHLKQRGVSDESDARQNSWRAAMASRPDCHFLLLGHDPVETALLALPNVSRLADHQQDLALHLACIGTARGFVGMQSGPANFAIFSDRPYVLFKNPSHHAAEMRQELGDGDQYRFAYPSQRVWRQIESPDSLRSAFDLILDAA